MYRPIDFKGKFYQESRTGMTKAVSDRECIVMCMRSNMPIMAGLYDTNGKNGVYYEVKIIRMEGIIAIGNAIASRTHRVPCTTNVIVGSVCTPNPDWRFPGWSRLGVGLHLDDCRKFYQEPGEGQEYETSGLLPAKGFTSEDKNYWIGFGYEFKTNSVFYTYNGKRLPNAFTGVYTPLREYDVYATIGIQGKNEFEVNFGTTKFQWKEGNEPSWKVGGHGGVMACAVGGEEEKLIPSDEEAAPASDMESHVESPTELEK